MIGKVTRGAGAGGLLRYLFGPGRANEHVDPHLVAGWDDVADLEPQTDVRGRHEVRRLAGLLEQPVAAAAAPPAKPVWPCSLRVAPNDRRLSDEEWADVARDVVHRTGLAPQGDERACRWVAVRHSDDHVHLVVTLARQDGRPARTSNDFYKVGEACRAAEQRYGLTPTARRDRTAARRPTRAESEKTRRAGYREPPRVTLRREVRAAAAGSGDVGEFLARLRDQGLLVRERLSERNPGEVTGYAVAWPGDRDRTGGPIWYGGGKLAADLTLPKLAARWDVEHVGSAREDDHGRDDQRGAKERGERARRPRLTEAERVSLWESASQTAARAAEQVQRQAVTDPAEASDAAHATSGALAATARLVEGVRGGPLTDAADAYDRAARELWGRTPRRTATGDGLRSTARLLTAAGRASKDETTQAVALIANLAALADAVAALRLAQVRGTQAAAALRAAESLRAVAPPDTDGRGGTATAVRRKTAGQSYQPPRPLRPKHVPSTGPRR